MIDCITDFIDNVPDMNPEEELKYLRNWRKECEKSLVQAGEAIGLLSNQLEQAKKERQVCPKCQGWGSVPNPHLHTTTGLANIQCPVCNGSKLLPDFSGAVSVSTEKENSNKARFDSLLESVKKVGICVSCEEEKQIHDICFDCISKMIKDNEQ